MAAVGLTLAACQSSFDTWVKPGAAAAEMDRERAECGQEAGLKARLEGVGDDRSALRATLFRDYLDLCLRRRGYRPPPG